MNNGFIKYGIIALIILFVLGIGFILRPYKKEELLQLEQTKQNIPDENLTPVDSITHGHGLAVDIADPNKLYIATHHGLLVLVNEKDLYRIGTSTDDYMGFTAHPSNNKTFYTSGHPANGGNMGFQISIDEAASWKKISDGVKGPVDFHAMTISPANPRILYGFFEGLQRSDDGGTNWQIVNNRFTGVYRLVADPKDENVIYVATGTGLFVSHDKGVTLEDVSPQLKDVKVVAFAIHPDNPSEMLSFSSSLGFTKSTDTGQTWQKVNGDFGGEEIAFITYNKTDPQMVYALSRNNLLYKSTNRGDTWNKIR